MPLGRCRRRCLLLIEVAQVIPQDLCYLRVVHELSLLFVLVQIMQVLRVVLGGLLAPYLRLAFLLLL